MSTEEQAAWDAANADITRLDAAIERQQRLDSLAALQTNVVIKEPGREDVRTSEPSDASTPQDLDLAFRAWMRVQGERNPSKAENYATPAFKGYRGYPASICASVNNEVIHGIPSDRVLEEGDILGLDLGVCKGGFYGDAAYTFPVGKPAPETERLLRVAEAALYAGIEHALPDKRISDISNAIQNHIESNGFSVVRAFVGHGIGRNLHEDPQVPNFGQPGRGPG